mgnify:CR=1 FL=1
MEAIDRIETVLEQREQTPYALCKFLGINQSSYSTWKLGTHYRQLNTLQTSPGFCTSLPTTF